MADSNLPRPAKTALAADDTSDTTIKKRRLRCLESRRLKMEFKRRHIESLQHELTLHTTTSYDTNSLPALPSLSTSSVIESTPESSPSSSSIVVSLPKSARQSARKMAKDPAAATQGRHEAQVLSRIHELQQQGLMAKKLKKIDLPSKPKTHWDYVVEEMNWLSGLIVQERKHKKLTCTKCAKMVKKHFTDKEVAEKRAEKDKYQNLRKIAAFQSKEIRAFWGNVEKLFEFTVRKQVERKQKQAMDQHLNFIVDRTEKISALLTESMNVENASSRRTTPNVSDAEMEENDEYEPNEDSDDDERTIARDEDTHEEGEIDDLNAEADIPIEELLKKFHPELYENEGTEDKSNDSDSNEYKNSNQSLPESAEPTPSTSSGIQRSQRRRKSQLIDNEVGGTMTPTENSSSKNDLKELVGEENKDFYDVVEMAAKFQPTGNTLDTTNVKTPVPFLLKHNLREYQHIGLDWMVSLHERKLNGILADEMGLGKTIQTIALLAHLACEKHVWGPHLIVVPTSVMLNWEMEIKKWAPAFKVLTYYGTQKERRLKRVGWTKPNAFHICITSYKLVTQDHSSFRRKQWQYLILDEAQHIKNFKSQRWQLLLNFPSVGRLLLTGTPLQNNLMELWSLMHFLMPHVFESHKDFKEWFSNPLTGMVEGSADYNDQLIQRLHKVLRPFLLRRLKSEVEKQLPSKTSHVVKCPLSKRQRFLYDDFMSRAKTRETLAGGNLLSVINVLMQLRKVCNHPNLFEPRPTVSPFILDSVELNIPKLFTRAIQYQPLQDIDISYSPLGMSNHELHLTAFAAHRMNKLRLKQSTVETHLLYNGAGLPMPCPIGKLKMTVRSSINPTPALPNIMQPKMPHDNKIPLQTIINNNLWKARALNDRNQITIKTPRGTFTLCAKTHKIIQHIPPVTTVHMHVESTSVKSPSKIKVELPSKKIVKEESSESDSKNKDDLDDDSGLNGIKRKRPNPNSDVPEIPPKGIFSSGLFKSHLASSSEHSPLKISPTKRSKKTGPVHLELDPPRLVKDRLIQNLKDKVNCTMNTNNRRCNACPLYGQDLISAASSIIKGPKNFPIISNYSSFVETSEFTICDLGQQLIRSAMHDILEELKGFFDRFHMYVHPAVSLSKVSNNTSWNTSTPHTDPLVQLISTNEDTQLISKMTSLPMLQTPETRLIQYDCGKLQVLAKLLRELQSGGHRALIFTQMTKVLDVLESFLNYHGYTYLRLDGSTKVEQRQVLMERFNANAKYFVFILSTRSGGVGINLTGADTVIFYDSDWNPTMDAQAQDRCHRIGQTRDVHIYRLVSERTIEENILKKANQKRLLGDLAIEGGNFTTAYFKKSTIRDLFDENEQNNEDNTTTTPEINNITEEEDVSNNANEKTDKRATKAFVSAISAVEDNIDAEALKKASKEVEADEAEFDEEVKPDDGLGTLMKQLSPIETYAFKHVEHIQKFWKECQIAAIDAEIEAQKKEFDEKKLEEMAEAIGAGASATPTEDGSTASETEVDEDDDDSDDEVDDGDSDDGSSDEDEDRVTVDDNDTENTEPTDSDDDSDRENSTAIESEDEKPIKRLKINTNSKFMKKSRKKSKKDSPLSPRTRSRGDVRINLFNLD